MWICKHCEMQNEDWEQECYLCGKPQKDPEPVVKTKEEPAERLVEDVASDPSYREVQPAYEDFAAAFVFNVPENEEYEPIAQEVEPDEADFEEVGTLEKRDEAYLEPLFSVADEETDDDIKIFIPEDEKTKIFEPDVSEPLQPNPPVMPIPSEPLWYESALYSSSAQSAPVPPQTTPEQPQSAPEQAQSTPEQQSPYRSPDVVQAQPPKTSEFDLTQFLSQIRKKPSEHITDEIRRKQEERKNQQPDNPPPEEQPALSSRALKKQQKAEEHLDTVTRFSKGLNKIAGIFVVLFLVLTAVFAVACIAEGNADSIPDVIDEIFYAFELHFRDMLYAIRY